MKWPQLSFHSMTTQAPTHHKWPCMQLFWPLHLSVYPRSQCQYRNNWPGSVHLVNRWVQVWIRWQLWLTGWWRGVWGWMHPRSPKPPKSLQQQTDHMATKWRIDNNWWKRRLYWDPMCLGFQTPLLARGKVVGNSKAFRQLMTEETVPGPSGKCGLWRHQWPRKSSSQTEGSLLQCWEVGYP